MEHTEPNLPDLNELCDYIAETYGKDIADRTYKCLLACMGISDEDVKNLPITLQLTRGYITEVEDKHNALKSQLNEAVDALKHIIFEDLLVEDMPAIHDIIAKHKEG